MRYSLSSFVSGIREIDNFLYCLPLAVHYEGKDDVLVQGLEKRSGV